MKTHTIKTPTAELMIVELPEHGDTFDDLTFLNSETEGYTLLGKPDEIKEEDAEPLVQNLWNGFRNYLETGAVGNYQRLVVNTAKESLLSLIESEIFWENPISQDLGFIGNVSETDMWFALQKQKRRFVEAQEKTFDRNRSIILVKN